MPQISGFRKFALGCSGKSKDKVCWPQRLVGLHATVIALVSCPRVLSRAAQACHPVITAGARKLRADGRGVETEIALDDWIDVGVFGEKRVDGQGLSGLSLPA